MSWVFEEFRDARKAELILSRIRSLSDRLGPVRFMNVCGTHEHTIVHYGLRSLLPEGVELVAGPGCPVCVTPSRDIDYAVKLASEGICVLTYGDMLAVPGSRSSLLDARAEGADVRVVYSLLDAVKMARSEPGKEFVFFAIGFETTAPTTAITVLKGLPDNLSILVAHRLIPPVMEFLLGLGDIHIDGFIAPGHVATVIGARAFQLFPEAYGMPVVVAGFEPLDILLAVLMLMRQLEEGRPRVENEYSRSVKWEGNTRAQELMDRAFEVVPGAWRGLGTIPSSALALRKAFSEHDAREKYGLEVGKSIDVHPGCSCHLIMMGRTKPTDCRLYGRACTPRRPMGPCMVSREGTCRIWFSHGIGICDARA